MPKSWKTFTPWILSTTSAILSTIPAHAVSYLSVDEAKKVCFSNANHFEKAHVIFSKEEIAAIEKITEQSNQTRGQRIWKAYQDQTFLGYFIIDQVIGKHELIDYVIALDPEGNVKQVEILNYRESYGYEVRSKHWRDQFVGKNCQSELELHGDIVNIGGATLSCRNVTRGVKKVLAVYETILKEKNK